MIPGNISYEDYLDLRELARCDILLKYKDQDKRVLETRKEIIGELERRAKKKKRESYFSPLNNSANKERIEVKLDDKTLESFSKSSELEAEVYLKCLEQVYQQEVRNYYPKINLEKIS